MFNGHTDKEIIQKILLGIPSNSEVLGFLYDSLSGVIWSVARNFNINSKNEIDNLRREVVHDFYTNVLNKKYRGESKISTYVHSIAKNKCLNKINSRRNTEHYFDPSEVGDYISESTDESPEAIALLAEKMIIHNEFIDLFSPRCKEVIRVKINSPDLSNEELAQKLNYKSAHSLLSFVSKCKKSLGEKILNDPILLGRLMDSFDDPFRIQAPLVKYADDFELILSYCKEEEISDEDLNRIEEYLKVDPQFKALIDYLKSRL